MFAHYLYNAAIIKWLLYGCGRECQIFSFVVLQQYAVLFLRHSNRMIRLTYNRG